MFYFYFKYIYMYIYINYIYIFSWPERSQGRAIVLPPALALVAAASLAKC